ncbi:MAG: hypothetical protein CO094_10385 [Anaerolineae bacterium CG_4_9_14_3_um_filter_57_17]|nr:NAD(P)/FAD-dependent oxidoreductase [bacterium]NCT20840.1 NAD(P)/FAD-dependent oxidoreductase [bacterium]OIO84445.1 MAG: hypothetical protein AUK01_09515 [Anaerolineae bacterium CG2_30_57_67]PJB65212.1 MAG: hypothetical protein CO094_10385 [Anaerolineae bacterium CG_4_9_14_3_um_filter_57_17]
MALMKQTNVLIIGAGPAGIAAAIQLRRYDISFLLIEKKCAGGLLWNANLVENYPGFPNGVTGSKLVALMEKQMQRLGIEVLHAEVATVSLDANRFLAVTRQASYQAKVLVVASGTRAKPFPIAIPEAARQFIFSEVAPLLDTHNRRIVIIGAGDAAFDYALNLAKKRNFVTILNHASEVKCLELLRKRAAAQANIIYRAHVAVREIKVNETTGILQIMCEAERRIKTLEADHLLFAIGRQPQLEFLSAEIHSRKSALIEARRLYFIGDVKNELLRQTAIAAGDGLRAAMQIYQTLKEKT